MPINLLTNTAANSTIRSLSSAQKEMNDSLNRISSGLRVATVKDNVAAYSISTKMTTLLEGYKQAISNTGQAQSMLETANGGLSEMTKVLQRMKALSIQASSSNVSPSDKSKLNAEFEQLKSEADRLAKSTIFNGKTLLSGETTTSTHHAGVPSRMLGSGSGAGNGIAAFQFDQGTSEGGYALSYTSTGADSGHLTLNNIQTGFSEKIQLNQGAITSGTESYRFVASGATISLNANFNKNTSFGSDAAVVNAGAVTAGTGAITANAATHNDHIKITSTKGFLGDAVVTGQIVGSNFTGGNNVTLNLPGTNGVFEATGVDLSSVGHKTVVLQRNVALTGGETRVDSLTVEFDVTTAFNGSETGFTIDLNQLKNMATTQNTSSDTASFRFQVGATTASTDSITTSISSVTALQLGIADLSLVTDATKASSVLDTALEMVSAQQANVGAVYNRLSAAASNLSVATENFQAARAVLVETDVSAEMPLYVSKQILNQSAISMLAKSNEAQNYVMTLLR